jgi:iron complex outermembrane recepter protein
MMNPLTRGVSLFNLLLIYSNGCFAEPTNSLTQYNQQEFGIEEIIVTAQKREQTLQDTPIAMSVLSDKQLAQQGISSLDDLISGTVSSLNINPYGHSSSTLIIAIRGNGPGDAVQTSRDASVAVYLDEIYLGRTQGLDFELAEMKRIEVLRGPQGTLYGRNATAGAINLISKRPSGEFGIRQTLGTGTYDLLSSNTHIDLPQWAGISSKIDYLQTKRDGWVNNTDKNEADYNAFEKSGYRVSVDISPFDDFTAAYTYNDSHTETTQLYYQFYRDLLGYFGTEGGRQSETRFPIAPLKPTITEQQLHSLTLNWALSDSLTILSLSAYRNLDDKTRNNYAGTLYFNGLIEALDIDQSQFSQEFRLVGTHDRLDWVTGLYYYTEKTEEAVQQLFSLDIFSVGIGEPIPRITPPAALPTLGVKTELESTAVYGQATWTPPVLNDQLEITLGIRHTQENKSGSQTTGQLNPFVVPSDNQTDPSVTLTYNESDYLSIYAKWSTAHRSGGVHSRSKNMKPFKKEEVDTVELGIKKQGWNNRLRLNVALFRTDYEGMFIDIFDPQDFTTANTINAANTVEVDGAEIDLTIAPLRGMSIGLSYTYLDGDMPLQPNPLTEGALEVFQITQTPQHAGAFTLDYELPRLSFGTLTGHIDIVASAGYHHWPSGGVAHPDGYTLVNARVDLVDIPLSDNYGSLTLSLWGKNLTDEEYVISAFNFEEVATIHAFGNPRTAGIELKYDF